jgi:hypothetical protein
LLDLFGSGYVVEHCISAFLEIQKEKAYKIYITDCLFSITNMYSVTHGGKEPVSKRFAEILIQEKPKKEETADDIISRMREKAKRINK